MLEGKHLSFDYGSKTSRIFSDVTISISRGERIGLVGPSGLGKSTLAKILAGYLVPVVGTVMIDGGSYPRRGYNPVQLIFQHPEQAVNPRWRIRSILNESGRPSNELLERLGVNKKWMSRYPHELSGGELQRICLARALDERTHYLICDEMTSMLDALTQALIWRVVLDVASARSIGMLVISHDQELINKTCDRVMVL